MITRSAPAKVNLYLHIGAVRADGLHDLASLFVFTKDGDVVHVEDADDLSLTVKGPFAAALDGSPPEHNLVWKAAELLKREFSVSSGAAMTLEKNLPVAAGIGGGSADAAAALRALVQHWRINVGEDRLAQLAFQLGADVPACLSRTPVNVSGAGESLSAGPRLAPLWICLVNPGVEMPTGPVFRAFDAANPSPPPPRLVMPADVSYNAASTLFLQTRNDLEPSACAIAPEIKDVLTFLKRRPGALGARMSGSGATCFALFSSDAGVKRAAAGATARGWWALASRLCVG